MLGRRLCRCRWKHTPSPPPLLLRRGLGLRLYFSLSFQHSVLTDVVVGGAGGTEKLITLKSSNLSIQRKQPLQNPKHLRGSSEKGSRISNKFYLSCPRWETRGQELELDAYCFFGVVSFNDRATAEHRVCSRVPGRCLRNQTPRKTRLASTGTYNVILRSSLDGPQVTPPVTPPIPMPVDR